jgi:hypothetical protein
MLQMSIEDWGLSRALGDSRLKSMINRASGSTTYATPKFLILFSKSFTWRAGYIVALDEGDLVGCLPYMEQPILRQISFHAGFTKRIYALPADCYSGPIIDPLASKIKSENAIVAMIEYLLRQYISVSIFPSCWAETGIASAIERTGRSVKCTTYENAIKKLSNIKDSDELLKSYSKNHRLSIRRSQTRDVIVERPDDCESLALFYDLYTETYARAGMRPKFPYSLVVVGGRELIRDGLGHLYLAYKNDMLTAGLFTLVHGSAACDWLSATTSYRPAMADCPMHLLLHHAMADSLEAGFSFFELGGIPTHGLREFKLHWGVEVMVQPTYHMASSTVHLLFDIARAVRRTFR